MVIIRKKYPIISPPFVGTVSAFDLTTVGGFGTSNVVTYSAYDWKNKPYLNFNELISAGTGLMPILGMFNTDPGLVMRYPRCRGGNSNLAGFNPSPTPVTNYLTLNAIGGFGSIGAADFGGWLTGGIEPNGYVGGISHHGGSVIMATSVYDQWQSGDVLIFNAFDEGFGITYWDSSGPGVVTAEADVISHDQDRMNGIQAACERFKVINWYLPNPGTDPSLIPGLTALFQSISDGVAHSEFHVASTVDEINDAVLPALEDFFGA